MKPLIISRPDLAGRCVEQLHSSQSLMAQTGAVMRALAVLVLWWLVSPAQAADIYATSRFWGGTIIHLEGWINQGDDQKFARLASRYPTGTIVELDSPGGYAGPAFEIADTISARGFDTMLTADANGCASGCAYIWLSGRHAVVQQNALLCFHQARTETGEAAPPEVQELIAQRIQAYGLNRRQAWALANAAPPQNMRCATEWWAAQLGFQPQIVPTPYAMRLCQSKFCLARP